MIPFNVFLIWRPAGVLSVEDPGHDDFELWSPSEERSERCLFGRQVQRAALPINPSILTLLIDTVSSAEARYQLCCW
jgi:hypothetical protein